MLHGAKKAKKLHPLGARVGYDVLPRGLLDFNEEAFKMGGCREA